MELLKKESLWFTLVSTAMVYRIGTHDYWKIKVFSPWFLDSLRCLQFINTLQVTIQQFSNSRWYQRLVQHTHTEVVEHSLSPPRYTTLHLIIANTQPINTETVYIMCM